MDPNAANFHPNYGRDNFYTSQTPFVPQHQESSMEYEEVNQYNRQDQVYYGDSRNYYDREQYSNEFGEVQTQYGEDWSQQQQQHLKSAEPGYYYAVAAMEPHVFGAPVSAIAYDNDYQAMYVASGTQAMSQGRRWNHRASMLATHSTADGLLYSSVAGHPEAPAPILNAIYEGIFGVKPSAAANPRALPNHAFKPFYATTDPALPDNVGRSFQMGINDLIPAHGYVASVSPSGVRLHAHGGLQMADYHVEGMIRATPHPYMGTMTHITVGGMVCKDQKAASKHHILCMDLWQGLRVVSTYTMDRHTRENTAVTALATSHTRGSILAGCSDGQVRMLDSRSREGAKIKSHVGGVVNMAASADGTLVATAGYGSRAPSSSGAVFGFPDPTIFIYDIRYLGRGAIPHPFAGLSGAPRHLAFLPDVDGLPSNRLMVASGQNGGGIQIIEPFEDPTDIAHNFMLPPLDRGEAISSMSVYEAKLALGTSKGKILSYEMEGYNPSRGDSLPTKTNFSVSSRPHETYPKISRGSDNRDKQPLEMPSFEALAPGLYLEPTLLRKDELGARQGGNDKIKSIASAFMLCADPIVTSIGDPLSEGGTTFGPLATKPLVPPSKLQVSSKLLSNATKSSDFLLTISSQHLDLDVFNDHRPSSLKERPKSNIRDPLPNPNKFIYTPNLNKLSYEETLNKSKKLGWRNRNERGSGDNTTFYVEIPNRYRLALRPSNKLSASFGYGEYNKTGLLPGWDYPPTMVNAFVAPILMLLYLIPEINIAAAKAQFSDRSTRERSLLPEIGYVFHRIDGLAKYATIFPCNNGREAMTHVGTWAPLNFVSCLIAMPEADQLQILDGSPAAVDMPRRPEAFYRFLLYQIDKELMKTSGTKLIESLGGINFISVSEFVSGKGKSEVTSTLALTVDLFYELFQGKGDVKAKSPRFGEVLLNTLSRETRLRAWNSTTKTYETIIQRRIATALPEILSISCACAGRKEDEGIHCWRTLPGFTDHWLPEFIEIQLDESGAVSVWELIKSPVDQTSKWVESKNPTPLPATISKIILEKQTYSSTRKHRYQLIHVLSMIRDDLDRNCPREFVEMSDENFFGHHVLHSRIPLSYKKSILSQQVEATKTLLSPAIATRDTLVDPVLNRDVFEKRLEYAKERLENIHKEEDWVLFNGYNVSPTAVEDARAFHVKFKEPCLVVFRAMASEAGDTEGNESIGRLNDYKVPPEIIRSSSITNGAKSKYAPDQTPSALPGDGDLIAFDAEFVSVQDEESNLTESGTKVTLRETRHALARISVIDCRHGNVIFDDHVLPREPVVDYLTRFSGIVEKDLHPKLSPHHLISSRTAYLKLRCLVERGCIFVGHGLAQDFATVNLCVPGNQIIDTVEIYHKPAQRYISLRFLTNYVLKRDMQQDVHDSLEDALAAYELYLKSVELKEKGVFARLLDELYHFGQQTDWKLGVDNT